MNFAYWMFGSFQWMKDLYGEWYDEKYKDSVSGHELATKYNPPPMMDELDVDPIPYMCQIYGDNDHIEHYIL